MKKSSQIFKREHSSGYDWVRKEKDKQKKGRGRVMALRQDDMAGFGRGL